jgi:hypothetical protein
LFAANGASAGHSRRRWLDRSQPFQDALGQTLGRRCIVQSSHQPGVDLPDAMPKALQFRIIFNGRGKFEVHWIGLIGAVRPANLQKLQDASLMYRFVHQTAACGWLSTVARMLG